MKRPPQHIQINVKLIAEVSRHVELYKYNPHTCNDTDRMKYLWAKIGQKLNLSSAVCQRKWQSLKSYFLWERNRQLRTKKMSTWYFYRYMLFLEPYLECSRECNAVNSEGSTIPDILNQTKKRRKLYQDLDTTSVASWKSTVKPKLRETYRTGSSENLKMFFRNLYNTAKTFPSISQVMLKRELFMEISLMKEELLRSYQSE